MPIPTITLLPIAPTTTDPATFRARGDAFLSALNTLDDELNATISGINNALPSLDVAVSSANFQGTWVNQTTVIGQSWYYDGAFYRVLVAGNTSPITSPNNWAAIINNNGKNYIINGGFDRWDYATSQTTSGYGSDNRWNNFSSGSTKTHSKVASGDTERALFNSPYFSRTVVTSVAGVNNSALKQQYIENVTKLAGKTVTLSFWAKADSSKNIAIELLNIFGIGGTPSSSVSSIGSQLVALTSTWQKTTITITIPSIIGKTLGTNGVHTTSTLLRFWFDAGSSLNSNTASLGQQSGTFDIAEVQLEEGLVATPWTPYNGEFGGEVQACQRYLPIGDFYSAGQAYSATLAGVVFTFKDKARVAPTGVLSSGTFLLTTAGGGTTSAASPVLSSPSSTSAAVSFDTSGLTAGYATILLGVSGSILFTGCEL